MKFFMLFTVIMMVVACTRITVEGNSPEVKYIYGVPVINFSEGKVSNYKLSSIGFLVTNKFSGVGYVNQHLLAIHDPAICSAIFFIKDEIEFNKISEAIKKSGSSLENICIYREE